MNKDIKQGNVIAAEPFMTGGPFKKSVVFICEHSRDEGSLGFIVNRGTNMTISELLSDLEGCDNAVFYGGPVANDTIHYLHRVGDLLPNSKEVIPGVFWGGDFDRLKVLLSNGVINPFDIKFFIGYSGWSPGQIYDELNEGSWIVAESDINYVFNSKPSTWADVIETKGESFKVMAEMSDKISMN